MKLAHLILAHNNPEQLTRLVSRLNHKDADVYIHLDAKCDATEYTSESDNVFYIKKRENVQWWEYSTIQATLNGLEEILTTGKTYSHINLLSGNDYPLKSANHIHDFLFAHSDKTFIWYDLIFDQWIHGQVRINAIHGIRLRDMFRRAGTEYKMLLKDCLT